MILFDSEHPYSIPHAILILSVIFSCHQVPTIFHQASAGRSAIGARFLAGLSPRGVFAALFETTVALSPWASPHHQACSPGLAVPPSNLP